MFIHKDFGTNVRLGTVFTDCPFELKERADFSPCLNCSLCVDACPSGAIKGGMWSVGTERDEIFSPDKCSNFMKEHFKHIGRGAVCGICMSVCPYGKKK